MTHTGKCLCGAVHFEARDLPMETGACHCSMCRRHSGGVYFGIQVPSDNITYKGVENLGVFKSSEWAERGFCKTCGSTLYYRVTAPGPHEGVYHIAFGSLDDQSGIKMTGEIFIDAKPDAYAFKGNHSTMITEEVFAMFADSGGADG